MIVLRNGRYAYRVKCPWEGKNGKQLYAFKFASMEAYRMRMLPRLHPGTRKEGENAVEEPESLIKSTQMLTSNQLSAS